MTTTTKGKRKSKKRWSWKHILQYICNIFVIKGRLQKKEEILQYSDIFQTMLVSYKLQTQSNCQNINTKQKREGKIEICSQYKLQSTNNLIRLIIHMTRFKSQKIRKFLRKYYPHRY